MRNLSPSSSFFQNKVYYIVRFCGEKPLCFVTDMVEDGKEKALNGEDIDVVQDLYLWMKLISTLNVRNVFLVFQLAHNVVLAFM